MTKLISSAVRAIHDRLSEVISQLHQLTLEVKNEELQQTMNDLRNRMSDPFMFVIVGEVKAGKSSFINALLESEQEITATGVAPVTDSIQLIVYGEEEKTVAINPHLKKIYRDIPILEDIAIVDTPGTNTIVEHHQEITERFIPMSDLVVFVFDAKNPYRKSSWDFFDFIQDEWHKKVVFILQQKDLLSEEDLQVNINGLKEHATTNGVQDPRVFAVSALEELNGKENTGFDSLREWIAGNITGGQAPFLKLENILGISRTMLEKISAGIEDRRAQLEVDIKFRHSIEETLLGQVKKSQVSVEKLVNNLVDGYNRIALEKRNDIREDLGFFTVLGRSITSIFSKKASPKEQLEKHLDELELKLNNFWLEKLEGGLSDLADNIKLMTKNVELELQNSKTILKNDHEVFSNIAEKRNAVLEELRTTFQEFRSDTDNFIDNQLVEKSKQIGTSVTTGSGLAVVGVILAAVTKLTVFDITGGILTALGVALAGLTLSIQKKKILKTYDQEIQNGEDRLKEELSSILMSYIGTIKERIDENFRGFEAHIANEMIAVKDLEKLQNTLFQEMNGIDTEIQAIKPQ